MNEDSNAKLIRELKEEIGRLRNLLKTEGIMVEEGKTNVAGQASWVLLKVKSAKCWAIFTHLFFSLSSKVK